MKTTVRSIKPFAKINEEDDLFSNFKLPWWLTQVINIIIKLKRKARTDGRIYLSASQNVPVLLIFAEEGILMSIINRVNAIAKTASQKASSLELGFDSDIFCMVLICF